MSTAFAVETTIERDPEVVWSELTDWSKAHRWMSGIEGLEANGETARGTQLTFHTRGKDRHAEITDCEPGRRLVLRSVQGGVTADYTYVLEGAGDGRTHVRLNADCTTQGIWGLVAPLLRMAIRSSDSGQLAALKAHVEAAPSG